VIAFVVGTTAELIKVAPVYHALVGRGAKPVLWFSAQHVDEVAETLEDLQLPDPNLWLVPQHHAQTLKTPSQVPAWATAVARTAVSHRARMRDCLAADGRPGLVVVHGDTFTTPYGAAIGRRLLGARVAHVEAGMRTRSLLDPFPEELNRRVTTKLTDVHFAPTPHEVHNLRRARGVVVDTGANTVVDAVRLAVDAAPSDDDLPDEFGLATLHRFELLQRPERFREALELLRRAADDTPILYLAGAPERERIDRHGFGWLFDDRLIIRPKRRYLRFVPLLARARFVVTDSGGLQEEAAYLGVPCAIHRGRTERRQGLGQNVILTGMQTDVLQRFLDGYESLRRPSSLDRYHPSEIIADTLATLGYC
jgi:UDP-N-acetylglucosamine 2-epimerase (non-hydrolysing)